MKKVLSIILVVCIAFSLKGQVVMTQTDPAGSVSTVNTNADTSYHKVDLYGQTFNYHFLLVTVAGTKTSGTVAGTAIIQGSLDNSRWFTITDTTGTGSQSLSDGDNDKKWELVDTKYRYYRVRVITTGTQVSSYVCRLLGRKVAN